MNNNLVVTVGNNIRPSDQTNLGFHVFHTLIMTAKDQKKDCHRCSIYISQRSTL